MDISAPGSYLHCFGVGDGWPNKERNHSSFLYRFEDNPVLVDCGEPLCRTYLNAGYSFDDFDAITLSHFHGDHFGGFLMFLQGLWLGKRTKDLKIYMPPDGIPVVEQLIQLACLFKDLMPFNLEFHPLEHGKEFSVGDTLVRPVRTTHLESLREQFQDKYPHRFDCFGFGFQTPVSYVVHSADIGSPDDLIPLMDRPVDLMVCELAHFNPALVFEFVKNYEIKKLLLIHLPSFLWENKQEVFDLGNSITPDLDFEIAEQNQAYPFPSQAQQYIQQKLAQG